MPVRRIASAQTVQTGVGRRFLLLLAAATFSLGAVGARADDTVTLSITVKNQQFDPAELHAPPGKKIVIHVKNLNPIASEFESSDLHIEKIVPPAPRLSSMCGRSSRVATVFSTISTMRPKVSWSCHDLRRPCHEIFLIVP